MKRGRESYQEQSLSELQKSCAKLGLRATGARPILLERLRRHEQGEPVLTDEMARVTKGYQPLGFFSTHMQTNLTQMGFLCIHHNIIRDFILVHLEDADVFAMLYTCKYVQEDALIVLKARAQRQFGPGGTPLALSAAAYYQAHMDALKKNFPEKSEYSIIYLLRRHMKPQKFETDLGWGESKFSTAIKTIIERAIVKYGSIEGILVERARKQREIAQRAAERAAVFASPQVEERLRQCRELLDSTQYSIFSHTFRVFDRERCAYVLQNIDIFLYVYALCGRAIKGIRKLFHSYIRYEKPATLEALQTKFQAQIGSMLTSDQRQAVFDFCVKFLLNPVLPLCKDTPLARQKLYGAVTRCFYDYKNGLLSEDEVVQKIKAEILK